MTAWRIEGGVIEPNLSRGMMMRRSHWFMRFGMDSGSMFMVCMRQGIPVFLMTHVIFLMGLHATTSVALGIFMSGFVMRGVTRLVDHFMIILVSGASARLMNSMH